jgi:soluble lytic murein transglycosylase-like protein
MFDFDAKINIINQQLQNVLRQQLNYRLPEIPANIISPQTIPSTIPLPPSTITATNQQIIEAFKKANPDTYANLTKKDAKLPEKISQIADHYGLDLRLLLTSQKLESNGKTENITSHAGASGLNQIMPVTYEHVMNLVNSGKAKLPAGVTADSLKNYKNDPVANTIVSAIYLKHVVADQLKITNTKALTTEQITKILGAYNQGPYGYVASGGANNSETRNHEKKATNVLDSIGNFLGGLTGQNTNLATA